MKKKLKVAIIGVGGISRSHMAGYNACEDAEVIAFCDINEKVLKERGEEYKVTNLFTDAGEMLDKMPEIEAVSVCTWNSAHMPCAIAALNRGKHVLLEKPMALSADEAKKIVEASKKSGAKLMIGFVRRYGKDCKVAKELIDGGKLGDIYYAKATYLRRNGNPGGWFGDKSRSGGGPLIDLGVHVIDLVRYLIGKPKAVSVYGYTAHKLGNRPESKFKPPYLSVSATDHDICDVEDCAMAMIRFDNGAVLNVETSFALNIEKDEGHIDLFGSKGGLRIDPEIKLFSEVEGYMTNVSFAGDTGYGNFFVNEIAHFVDCVLNDKPFRSPAEDGVELMKILDAVYESARTGHEVILK